MNELSLEAEAAEIVADAERLQEESGLSMKEAMEVIWGHGCADDFAGDVDTIGHSFRVGRFILDTDSQGFTELFEFPTLEQAEREMDRTRALERATVWGDDLSAD